MSKPNTIADGRDADGANNPAAASGRSVPEWFGSSPDAAIPPRVKLRIWERCAGRCALTGKKLMVGEPYDFDHIIPLTLGGEHKESNLQVVSREAHKAKTRADVAVKSKVARIRSKHLGITKPKGSLSHPTLVRGFDGKVRAR